MTIILEVDQIIHAATERPPGYVDEIIVPEETRRALAAGLRLLRGKRERAPSRRHGNIPL